MVYLGAMEIDLNLEWSIVLRASDAETAPPVAFAVEELARVIRQVSGALPRIGGDGSGERLIIVDCGNAKAPSARPSGYCWRANEDRIELYGGDGPALVRCIYDFLGALGASWPAPGADEERLPADARIRLVKNVGSLDAGRPGCTLILGHGAYMERWEDYLVWAARNGYYSVFFHTTDERLALGAIPSAAYEARRLDIAALAAKLGLEIELGGHLLSQMLPRRLFRSRPELFRMAEGRRRPDGNLCPSSGAALELISQSLADFALDHPEAAVFHVWPEDLPGGGWCSCPECAAAGLGPAAGALATAIAMAGALATVRPEARLSFLAYHDTDNLGSLALASLPHNLELAWAPRRRSWASGLDEPGCALNAASAAAFRRAAGAWRAAGGGRVTVFEYWEDGFLFKGAVPPRPAALAGDLSVYAASNGTPAEGADGIGILFTGGRLPLAPRPNPWLLPRLVAGADPGQCMHEWVGRTYGSAAEDMAEYWAALESAWSIALDTDSGDGGIRLVSRLVGAIDDPPSDWGDPWNATVDRLADLRGRCEELFDFLRTAESALDKAEATIDERSEEGRAVLRERSEYRIASRLLELDCARLSVYHELAAGETRAAADLALLAQAALGAFYASLSAISDPRSRRELRLIAFLFYGLRLRAIRRASARNPLRRLLDRGLSAALVVFRLLPLRGAWERHRNARTPRR